MSASAPKKSSRDKVRAHRARLRAQGLRPVQFWLPDLNAPEIREQIRQECLAIVNSPTAADDEAFVESVRDRDWGEWNEE